MEDLHQEPAQPEMQLQQPDAVAATEPAQNHILQVRRRAWPVAAVRLNIVHQADPESTGTENPASEDGQMESSNQSENVGKGLRGDRASEPVVDRACGARPLDG